MNPSEHKKLKGVEKGEVRDHMTGLELAFTNVAEQATIANIHSEDAQGYDENYDAAQKGGRSAGVARTDATGRLLFNMLGAIAQFKTEIRAERQRELHDLEKEYLQSMEKELEIGRNIQLSFLPKALPQIAGWEIKVLTPLSS